MPISSFNEISGLIAYYNPTDLPPEVDGSGNITVMRDGYGGTGPDLAQNDAPTTYVTYDDAERLGNMKCINATQSGASGLIGQMTRQEFPDGCTAVIVYDSTTGDAWAYHVDDADTTSSLAIRRAWGSEWGSYHTTLTSSGNVITNDHRPFNYNEPISHVARVSKVVDEDDIERPVTSFITDTTTGSTFFTDTTRYYPTATDRLYLGKNEQYNFGLRGRIGLFALYNRGLTDAEVVDVQTLCQEWLINGQAPEVTYPTAVEFGPVLANDLSATLVWEVLFDDPALGTAWTDISQVTSTPLDYTLATSDGGQDGNILRFNSAAMGQDCQIRCRATTAYNTEGTITPEDSTTAKLRVVEAT